MVRLSQRLDPRAAKPRRQNAGQIPARSMQRPGGQYPLHTWRIIGMPYRRAPVRRNDDQPPAGPSPARARAGLAAPWAGLAGHQQSERQRNHQ